MSDGPCPAMPKSNLKLRIRRLGVRVSPGAPSNPTHKQKTWRASQTCTPKNARGREMGFGAELKEAVMNPNVRTILGMIAGIGIGAAGVQVLHATNHAPVYYVAEQDISNPEGYANEFVPRAAALIKAAGGRY